MVDHTYDSAASWMSVGWPGFIGVLSGINEHGTVISVNFGADGERNLENTQNLPVGLLLRLSLETANPNEPVESTEEIIANHEKRTGVVIHLTYPNQVDMQESSVVFETDGTDTVVRYSDFDFPEYDHIIAKNHFIEYETSIPDPEESVRAYDEIARLLEREYQSDNGKIDLEEVRGIIQQISLNGNHWFIAVPSQMHFELAIRHADLTFGDVQSYSLSELLPGTSIPPPATRTLTPTVTKIPTRTVTPTPTQKLLADYSLFIGMIYGSQ